MNHPTQTLILHLKKSIPSRERTCLWSLTRWCEYCDILMVQGVHEKKGHHRVSLWPLFILNSPLQWPQLPPCLQSHLHYHDLTLWSYPECQTHVSIGLNHSFMDVPLLSQKQHVPNGTQHWPPNTSQNYSPLLDFPSYLKASLSILSCSEALQIAVKRREVKNKGEKERNTHLNAEF